MVTLHLSPILIIFKMLACKIQWLSENTEVRRAQTAEDLWWTPVFPGMLQKYLSFGSSVPLGTLQNLAISIASIRCSWVLSQYNKHAFIGKGLSWVPWATLANGGTWGGNVGNWFTAIQSVNCTCVWGWVSLVELTLQCLRCGWISRYTVSEWT